MIPAIIGVGVVIFLIWFVSAGGIEDIGENISILIMGIIIGALAGSVLL